MLILTRRQGETIRIGEQVAITVVGVQGNQVRIGISAPREMPVHREEIYEKIHGKQADYKQRVDDSNEGSPNNPPANPSANPSANKNKSSATS